jgi:hypothetical protein
LRYRRTRRSHDTARRLLRGRRGDALTHSFQVLSQKGQCSWAIGIQLRESSSSQERRFGSIVTRVNPSLGPQTGARSLVCFADRPQSRQRSSKCSTRGLFRPAPPEPRHRQRTGSRIAQGDGVFDPWKRGARTFLSFLRRSPQRSHSGGRAGIARSDDHVRPVRVLGRLAAWRRSCA